MLLFRVPFITAPSSPFSRCFALLFLAMVVTVPRYGARPIKNHNQQKGNGNKLNGDRIPSAFDKLKVPPENFENVRHLHDTLYYGAVKALIGQVGRKHYKELTETEKQKLAKCLDRIETRKREVVEAAKCLIRSRKGRQFDGQRTMGWGRQLEKAGGEEVPFVQEEEKRGDKVNARGTGHLEKSDYPLNIAGKSKRLLRYMGRRRRERSLLISERSTDQNRTLSHKAADEAKTIGDMLSKQRNGPFVGEERLTKAQQETFKSISSLSSVPLASRSDKSIGSRVTNLIAKLLGGRRNERTNERWQNVYERLKRMTQAMERRKRVPGSKVFEKRMYDIVLDREEASMSPEERHSPVGLLQDGLKLIDLAIANRTLSSSHNVRLFSPRFLPLTPDKGGSLHNNSLLSPTLLAMYDEHDNRSIGNVPEMLRNAGVGEQERLELIGKLMDVTGTMEKAEQTLELFKEMNMFDDGVGGPLMETADRIVKAFFALEDSMDAKQKEQCERNGYTFARREQIEKLLRDQAVDLTKLPELEAFDEYDRMSHREKESALWATIEQIAAGNAVAHPKNRRVKRTFATRVREPTILSPFIFAPSHGLAVLGPTILSPNAFSPSILAPTVFVRKHLLDSLSPHILSPNLFRAQILSPTVMSPAILTPLMAHPYVLSPAVLGSLILNPTILTPFILTPVAISPSIFNPFALSPVIFSPLLLAPDIVSPQTLGGAIFSPVMLSPAILTQAYLMVSIFSPSFLS